MYVPINALSRYGLLLTNHHTATTDAAPPRTRCSRPVRAWPRPRATSPGPPEHTTEHTIAAFCCSCRRATRHTTNTAQPFQTISITDSCSHASRVSLLRRRHAATARVLDLFNEAFGTQLQMLTLFDFAMTVSVVLPEYSLYLPRSGVFPSLWRSSPWGC